MSTLSKTADNPKPTISKGDLEKLETKVREGMQSFVEVGQALMEIRERHGYVVRGYKSFPDYCERYLHITERHGLRLIDGAVTVEKVKKAIGDAPRNEASARVLKPIAGDAKLLGRLKDKLKEKKLDVATATAEKLQEVVDKITPKTRPMFPDEKPVIKESPSLTDACPNCQQVPAAYTKKGEAWHCGNCDAVVMVGVIAAKAERCSECNAVLPSNATYCGKCGEPV